MNFPLIIGSIILGVLVGVFTGSALLGAFTGIACYFGGSLDDNFPTPRHP
jgi:uncharacterized membrane protein